MAPPGRSVRTSRLSPSDPQRIDATPRTGKMPAPGTQGPDPRSSRPAGTSPSACSTWPGSPRSPGPCRPSDVTGPGCSATCRYETGNTTDFADPVNPNRATPDVTSPRVTGADFGDHARDSPGADRVTTVALAAGAACPGLCRAGDLAGKLDGIEADRIKAAPERGPHEPTLAWLPGAGQVSGQSRPGLRDGATRQKAGARSGQAAGHSAGS